MDSSDARVSSPQGMTFDTNEAMQSLKKALKRAPGRTKMANLRLMYGRIEACLRSGIRLAEVAAVLADEHGIVISASTLQSSMSRIRKERGFDRKSVKSKANFGSSLVRDFPNRKTAN